MLAVQEWGTIFNETTFFEIHVFLKSHDLQVELFGDHSGKDPKLKYFPKKCICSSILGTCHYFPWKTIFSEYQGHRTISIKWNINKQASHWTLISSPLSLATVLVTGIQRLWFILKNSVSGILVIMSISVQKSEKDLLRSFPWTLRELWCSQLLVVESVFHCSFKEKQGNFG